MITSRSQLLSNLTIRTQTANYVSRDKRIETRQAKGDLNKPKSEQIEAEKERKDKIFLIERIPSSKTKREC